MEANVEDHFLAVFELSCWKGNRDALKIKDVISLL